jgi:hypothetical protein
MQTDGAKRRVIWYRLDRTEEIKMEIQQYEDNLVHQR